jgi:hypothetical protein
MRKIGLLVAALAIVAVCVPAAFADINLPAGPVWGHLSDWSSLYRDGVPYDDRTVTDPLDAIPQPGDEGRALASVNQFYDADTNEVFWSPALDSGNELTVLEYDFVVPGGNAWWWNGAAYQQVSTGTGGLVPGSLGKYELFFVPGENGGRIDAWYDTTPDWAGTGPGDEVWTQGPTEWDRPGDPYVDPYLGSINPDDYPGASDLDRDGVSTDAGVSLWLTGTYAPLFSDDNLNSVRDLTEMDLVWFDQWYINGNVGTQDAYDPGIDPVGVYGISGWTPGGLGTGYAWIDFDGGSYFPNIVQDSLGIGYDLSLSADLHPSRYGDRLEWGTRSSDPTYMEVIPEPTSFALLGLGIVGLVGRVRRRRRK